MCLKCAKVLVGVLDGRHDKGRSGGGGGCQPWRWLRRACGGAFAPFRIELRRFAAADKAHWARGQRLVLVATLAATPTTRSLVVRIIIGVIAKDAEHRIIALSPLAAEAREAILLVVVLGGQHVLGNRKYYGRRCFFIPTPRSNKSRDRVCGDACARATHQHTDVGALWPTHQQEPAARSQQAPARPVRTLPPHHGPKLNADLYSICPLSCPSATRIKVNTFEQ